MLKLAFILFTSITLEASQCIDLYKDKGLSSPYQVSLSTNYEVLDRLFFDKEAYPQKNIQAIAPYKQISVDTEYVFETNMRRAMLAQDLKHIYASSQKPYTKRDELEAAQLIAESLSETYPEQFQFQRGIFENKITQEKIHLSHKTKAPLLEIAKHIQEDLIIVRPNKDGEYIIRSGFLAFPSNWYLRSYLEAPMSEIHQGLGKDGNLGHIINKILARLNVNEPITRNNWFINEDPSQAQTIKNYGKTSYQQTSINSKNVLEHLYLRSEYQSLTKLPSGAVLFTIKVYTFRLADIVHYKDIAERILRGIMIKQITNNEAPAYYNKYLFLRLAEHSSHYKDLKTFAAIKAAVNQDVNKLTN